MKITNNEIVVNLPHIVAKDDIKSSEYNRTVRIIKQMNPPLVVDVEALAKVIFYDKYLWVTWGGDSAEFKSWEYNCTKQAQHLAANLDKWMIEKKENKCDLK